MRNRARAKAFDIFLSIVCLCRYVLMCANILAVATDATIAVFVVVAVVVLVVVVAAAAWCGIGLSTSSTSAHIAVSYYDI